MARCCGTEAQLFVISMLNIVNALLKVKLRLSMAAQRWELSVVAGPGLGGHALQRVVVAPLCAAGKEE